MKVMESNRLEAAVDTGVRAGITRHVAWLDVELEDADRRLEEAVKASPAWQAQDEPMRSIPGIGPVVSRTLLAALPEPGTIDGGLAAAPAGLAPFALDSGTMRGPLVDISGPGRGANRGRQASLRRGRGRAGAG